jgi:DNA gyrase inhibitor GyrI
MKKNVLFLIVVFCLSTALDAQDSACKDKEKLKVTVKDVQEINMVYYEFTGPYDQSFNNFGELMAYIQQNNIPMGANSLGIFYDDPATVSADKLRSDIGFVVAKKVDVTGNYKFKTIPAGKAVAVKYSAMDEIMLAYEKVSKYIMDNGIKTAPYSIEMYYSADPNVVDAEILFMIVD